MMREHLINHGNSVISASRIFSSRFTLNRQIFADATQGMGKAESDFEAEIRRKKNFQKTSGAKKSCRSTSCS